MTLKSARDDTTATFRRPGAAQPLGVVLRVLNRPAKPRELRLSSGECVVGAGTGVDLVIMDDTVSRRHAVFSVVPAGVMVRDLSSHNGTHYLGNRVEEVVLGLGSTVTLGRAEIRVEPDRESLARGVPEDLEAYGALVGSSPALKKVFGLLTRLESSLVNVLVEGESGTGKELIARAIHDHSPVADGPFVAVNCGAMDRDLVKSQLFGHARGAFTGAVEARPGAFEAAHGGTMFLDELGELPMDVQPVLLRALESSSVVRLGETAERKVSVRIVGATNRELSAEVKAGRFREDLFFRLMVVHLRLPALRDRLEDVPRLARLFAKNAQLAGLPDDVMAELLNRHWPGNVRELKNAIDAYAVLGSLPDPRTTRDAEFEHALRRAIDPLRPYAEQKREHLRRFQRLYLE
ncbi:MAG TPA: sigma 54-interacting transcriptional regulator, partial [Polyangiaceae bacterium]